MLPDKLLNKFETLVEKCNFPPPGEFLPCAVSGGPDSLALMVLATIHGCQVEVIHVDHGIRSEGDQEAQIVAKAAKRFGATFRSEKVYVAPGPNIEARARQARFNILPKKVATGHTADDQAETVLLNLLRGTGIDGLSGMSPSFRHPILSLRRSDTHQICSDLDLEVVMDPSNLDPRFKRNLIRHKVLGLLSEVAERDIVPLLARQALLYRDESELLDNLSETIDPSSVHALITARPALARRALRRWLKNEQGYPPSASSVERVMNVAKGLTRATEIEGGVRIRRSQGTLFLERNLEGNFGPR